MTGAHLHRHAADEELPEEPVDALAGQDVQDGFRVKDSRNWPTGQSSQAEDAHSSPGEQTHAPSPVLPVAPLLTRDPLQVVQEVARDTADFQVFTGHVTATLVEAL